LALGIAAVVRSVWATVASALLVLIFRLLRARLERPNGQTVA
jgi:hypothetical protein